MAYIGIFLALVFLYGGYKKAFKPRETEWVLCVTPFAPIYVGTIFGTALLISTVGPFVLFGAAWPSIQVMATVMALSIFNTLVFHWIPLVRLVDWIHGVERKTYKTVLFWETR